MSRDNNNSDRPKRPRISTKKSSDDSRASRSGNSSGSKPFKKPFSKDGGRKGPEHTGSNSKFEKKPFKRNTDSFDSSNEDFGSRSEKNHTSRIKVRAMRKNLSENLKEAEGASIQEISMKEVA